MNTIAATTHRIPRPALIGVVVLIAAFAALMIVRVGVLGGSSSTTPTPSRVATPSRARQGPRDRDREAKARPPPEPSHARRRALRYSKVVVVSLYVGQAPGDRAAVVEARKGARSCGAGFVAVNVGSDKTAAELGSFAGPVSLADDARRPPSRQDRDPDSGPVESAVVAQAAHNAGARR